MNDYSIVPLDAETLRYLYLLYENVYQKRIRANYFELKYDSAYTGQQYLGYFALHGKQPVAFYGVIPMRVSIGGAPVLAAQSCDTMTDPGHRKNGLFIRLAQLTFKLAKQRGIHFVFGFPNYNSYSGFVKHLGFDHSHNLNRYTLIFGDNLVKKLKRRLFASFPEKPGPVIKNYLPEQGFDGLIYDEAFMGYKRYNPNFIWQEEGLGCWLQGRSQLFAGALSIENKEILIQLLHSAEKKLKAASITFMISPGTLLDRLLFNQYKAEEGFPVILKDLTSKYNLAKLRFQFADLDIF